MGTSAKIVALALMLAPLAPASAAGPKVVPLEEKGARIEFWLETSLHRVYPGTKPGSAALDLLSPRRARIAFQACIRNESVTPREFSCTVAGADDLKPRTRLVGLVPLPHFTSATERPELEGVGHVPGLVPDPLLPETKVTIGPYETRSFWITLNIPADAKPGPREFTARLAFAEGKEHIDLPANLDIAELVVKPRRDFPVIHWWRGEATWDYYKTGMFEDERWWSLTKAQLENMLDHGSDVVYVPLLFDRREAFRRPCQLLIVDEPEPGKYKFDWSLVERFVGMAREIGFEKFEWSHLWIYWGAENPMRIYKKVNGKHEMLWPPDISGFSDTYINFLKQFLPEFREFLERENLLESSYFHLTDEPGGGKHLENYRRARQVLRELAPWMKVMDALSDVRYGKEGLTDIPVPIVDAAQGYIDAKIPHWVYYCCGPHGPWLNRFLDTPLAKVRMSGWLFHRLEARGFLHWGFNYWHKMEQEVAGDPFRDSSNGSWPFIPYGDPFVIYPGEDGPLDSIRWEVFAESLQDYAILQSAGIEPGDPLLQDLKTYADFPKDEAWIRSALEKVLKPGAEPARPR